MHCTRSVKPCYHDITFNSTIGATLNESRVTQFWLKGMIYLPIPEHEVHICAFLMVG